MCASTKRVNAFARLRPSADFPQDMIKLGADNQTINFYVERDRSKGVVNNKQTDWSFKLDGVLHHAAQELVYDTVARDLVSQALDGYNGTIICYGQTGAGKTYTMTGTTQDYEHRGIIPRAIQQVFKAMEEHSSQFMTIRVSYLEIHNETIFDLLSSTPHAPGPPLSVVDGPQGVSVKGLTVHTCPSEEMALNFLFECHSRIMSDATFVTSKINLVDLAGSERLAKTKSEGRGLKETTYISKSLSFFEQVVLALSERNREHVPFRQSKLTHTLKDSLGGNCNTVLVANICSEAVHIVETLSTLRFATRMKWVTTAPVVNEKYDTERLLKNVEKEVLYLKEELAVHNSLLNRPPVTYEPLNEIQVAEINSQVRRFLEGTIDELEIVSLRQIHEIFNQFKAILSQQEQEVEARLRSKYTLIDKNDFATLSAVQKAGLVDADGHMVGEVDGQGFGIGVAPFSSKPGGKRAKIKKGKEQPSTPRKEGLASPVSGKELDSVSASRSQGFSKEQETKEAQDVLSVETHRSESVPKDEAVAQPSCPPTRMAAFEDFKNERGSEINRIFKENKAILNDRKKKMGEVTRRINALKREMDATKQALEAQKMEREQQGEYLNEEGQVIIEEEEFLLLVKLKDLQKQYRADFGEFRDLQSEVQYCQHLVDQCRRKLLTEFEIWYNESFLIPEEVQEALKPSSGALRLGMIPINRVLTLDEDEQERFDRMQQEVLPYCPDSVSFYNAKAKTDRKHKYSQAMTALEQMRKKPSGIQPMVKNKPPSVLEIT